jgi:hypothetical protein
MKKLRMMSRIPSRIPVSHRFVTEFYSIWLATNLDLGMIEPFLDAATQSWKYGHPIESRFVVNR